MHIAASGSNASAPAPRGEGEGGPLATIGVLSAAAYAYRRQAARETWASREELTRLRLVASFVIASANATAPRVSGEWRVPRRGGEVWVVGWW